MLISPYLNTEKLPKWSTISCYTRWQIWEFANPWNYYMESKRGGVMFGCRNEDTFCTVVTMLMLCIHSFYGLMDFIFLLKFKNFLLHIWCVQLVITYLYLITTIRDNPNKTIKSLQKYSYINYIPHPWLKLHQ